MTSEEFERARYEALDRIRAELRRALCQTQAELSRLRASCYALDALLEELGFPSADEREDRFGYEAARRISQMRGVLLRQIEEQEKARLGDARRWSRLSDATRNEPEHVAAATTGIVDVAEVALAVIERLREKKEPKR